MRPLPWSQEAAGNLLSSEPGALQVPSPSLGQGERMGANTPGWVVFRAAPAVPLRRGRTPPGASNKQNPHFLAPNQVMLV